MVNFTARISTLEATEMTCQNQDSTAGKADGMTELMQQLTDLFQSLHRAATGSVAVTGAPWWTGSGLTTCSASGKDSAALKIQGCNSEIHGTCVMSLCNDWEIYRPNGRCVVRYSWCQSVGTSGHRTKSEQMQGAKCETMRMTYLQGPNCFRLCR